MTTPSKSRVFSSRRPLKPHLLQRTGGIAAETLDLREDTEKGFLQVQAESGGTTAERVALGVQLTTTDRGHTFFDQTLIALFVWDGVAWVNCCVSGGIVTTIGVEIYTLSAIQAITAATQQFLPTGTYHRFTSAGNITLTSTPEINWPGAVPGQALILQNVGTPGFGHITINRGVGPALSLSNAASRIDEGGTMKLIFDGTNWIEHTHTQATST